MPNPQFTKPWHGVPRESIYWNPACLKKPALAAAHAPTLRVTAYRSIGLGRLSVLILPLSVH